MRQSVLKMKFSQIYPMYVDKVVKKGRTQEELDTIIFWLTGHNEASLKDILANEVSLEVFFRTLPKLNDNAHLITGSICGYKVEEIANPLERRMRMLDKIVDELAKGKALDKIMRK